MGVERVPKVPLGQYAAICVSRHGKEQIRYEDGKVVEQRGMWLTICYTPPFSVSAVTVLINLRQVVGIELWPLGTAVGRYEIVPVDSLPSGLM